MKPQLLAAVLLFMGFSAFGQIDDTSCVCPQNPAGYIGKDKPEDVFIFSVGQRIILCGYRENVDDEILYNEFNLQVCGQDSVLGFWPAIGTYKVYMNKDTLKVVELKSLPNGIDRAHEVNDWTTERFYFSKGQLKRIFQINRSIKKYTKAEIAATIKEFETSPTKIDDDVFVLLFRLFHAAISGSKTAEKHLVDFGKKFQLDGHLAEEHSELVAMLELWKR